MNVVIIAVLTRCRYGYIMSIYRIKELGYSSIGLELQYLAIILILFPAGNLM